MPRHLSVTPSLAGLVALLAIALAACDTAGTSPAGATPEPAGETGLDGTAWTIQSIGGTTLAADPPATLTVGSAGEVSGETGCNRFSGTMSLDGAALTFGPLSTTRMACEPPLMEQERAVLDALGGVTGWSVGPDGTLRLTGATELVLTPGAR